MSTYPLPASATSAPSSKLVSAESPSNANGESDIYVSDADGSNKTNVTLTNGVSERSPSWSPDGQRIVFSELNSGNLFVMNADGRQTTRLSPDPTWRDIVPVWSPVAPLVAVVAAPRNSNQPTGKIFIVDVASKQRRLLVDQPGFDPTFSADGKWIAYRLAGANGSTLQVVSTDGMANYRLVTRPISIRRMAWTTDSKLLAYEAFVRDTNADGKIDERDQSDVFIASLQPLTVQRLAGIITVVSPRGKFPGPPIDGEFYPPVVSTVRQSANSQQ